eukprot:PhM_4_TR12548/c0_g1_i1/m.58379/K18532/AK6, FAP7; adenylate kinase
MTDRPRRSRPNIVVTGTPGTGKTTMSEVIAQAFGFTHVNVGKLVSQEGFHESYDEEFDAHVPDEDRLLDHLETVVADGGVVLDFHSCELYPERWVDLVLVLSAKTEVLFDRLRARGYSDRKVEENMDAEIHRVCEDEARESYPDAIIMLEESNEVGDMDRILADIQQRLGL